MQDLLSKLIGKKGRHQLWQRVESGGEVMRVEAGVLHLVDAQQEKCYAAIDKIVAVEEAEDDAHKAGFVSKH